MLPKKYHAIAFIGILVMLLLLGLHILGIGYTSGQASAKTAALARNTSQSLGSAFSNQADYKHPIAYDKLTGATNNQINDVLGSSKHQSGNFPIDHYQQQQQLPPQFNNANDDIFFGPRPGGFSPPPPLHHMRPPPPPHLMSQMPHMMTTPPPPLSQQQPPPQQPGRPPTSPLVPLMDQQKVAGASSAASSTTNQQDSLPSASSIQGNGARANTQPQQQQAFGQPQQIYYTPPIFAYNQLDQNRLIGDGYGYGLQPQQLAQQQMPSLGVPEAPMSVEEYNARQARLGNLHQPHQQPPQQQQQQLDRYGLAPSIQPANHQMRDDPYTQQQQSNNLLADPQQQARHKQQMLDRQVLFGGGPSPQNANMNPQYNQNISAYYPDPALHRTAPARAPYAQNMQPLGDLEYYNLKPQAQNRIMQPPTTNRISELQSAKATLPQQRQSTSPAQASSPTATSSPQKTSQQLSLVPVCARQESNQTAMFCLEDTEYPNREIMRALEIYANDRSIEQILPQSLLQIHLAAQRGTDATGLSKSSLLSEQSRGQITLDSLQPNLVTKDSIPSGAGPSITADLPSMVRSSQFEQMCRSTTYMAQPRRAKNLLGQWKIVVNLPGHKYRGIAVNQMVRVEECTRSNEECLTPGSSGASTIITSVGSRATSPVATGATTLPRSRCLQQYENQRLLSWSHQQGLHMDIFRVPIACSCHIRR